MSLLYDESQEAIASESARVLKARTELAVLLGLIEASGAYDETFWATAKEQGWTGIAFPGDFGGLDLGLVELGLVAEAAGSVCAGAPFLTTSFGAGHGLVKYGTDALREAWLPKLAAGEAIGAVAFAERQSPLPSTPTVSFKAGKLDGTKPAVPAGLHADLALVLASGEDGPVLVAVDLGGAGVERRALATFDNSRCAADLVFAGAAAEVLISGPSATKAALDILAAQAVVTAHEQVGGAAALLERSRNYANERKAFGQPIGAFQSVKHRIAEMYVLVELARANAIHAAAVAGTPEFLKAAAAARLSASEAYDTAARDTVQIHGGIGVTWEAGLHLHQRRTRTLSIEQGQALFWEDLLVDEIAGAAA
jgi:alkylation response protein AidB-like acyl-CoA dehydrogenase